MGNDTSKETVVGVVKKVGSVTLALSYFTPAVVVTAPATAVIGGAGLIVKGIGHATDDEDCKEAGNFFAGMAFDAAVDGVSGGAFEGVKTCAKTVRAVKVGCDAWNVGTQYLEAEDARNGKTIILPSSGEIVTVAKTFKVAYL